MPFSKKLPHKIEYISNTLYKNKIFNSEIKKLLETYTSYHSVNLISQLIRILDEKNLLNEENIKLILRYSNFGQLTLGFEILLEARLLNEKNIRWILIKQDAPDQMALALKILHKANLLDEKNVLSILLHFNPFGVARAFKTLSDAKILNSLNIILTLNDRDPYSMARVLTVIKDVGLLQNKDIINLFIGYGGSDSLRGLLNTLYQSDLLKEENIKVVLTYHSPEQMILALKNSIKVIT